MGSDLALPEGLDTGSISIHAPRMGSDIHASMCRYLSDYFNPRSPDGERLSPTGVLVVGLDISIHAPRMGSDLSLSYDIMDIMEFQSTLPGWGATAKMDIFAHDMGKIIHFQH